MRKQLGNCHNFGNEILWEIGAFCLLTVGHACWAKPSYCLAPLYTVVLWGLIWNNWENVTQIGIEILLAHQSLFLLWGGILMNLGASGVVL